MCIWIDSDGDIVFCGGVSMKQDKFNYLTYKMLSTPSSLKGLLFALKKRYPAITEASVQRALDHLVEEGIVRHKGELYYQTPWDQLISAEDLKEFMEMEF